MRNAFFFLFSLIPVACTVSANVGDFPKAATGDDGGGDARAFSGDAMGDGMADGGGPDGPADAPFVDAGCGVGFAQQGSFIDVQSNPQGPPEYAGGTIVAGFYVLTSMTYFTQKAGTAQRRETLNVRGAAPNGAFERLVEQQNPTGDYMAIAAHGESSTWMVESPFFLFESPECPTIDTDTGNYTATSTTLTVFTGGGDPYERVYARVP